MFIPRVYYAVPLTTGQTVKLTAAITNYLLRVLRLEIQADFILFNGEGGEYAAKISAINKNQVSAQVGEFSANNDIASLHIHLGQSIARGEKMDFVIQKAVELGVESITPLISARCSVKFLNERADKRLQHWRAVVIAACEQSGRQQLPVINAPVTLDTWLNTVQADLKLICNPAVSIPLKTYCNTPTSVALLIGPESGFTADEVTAARVQAFKEVSLGPRILRTETAAIAAVTAVQVMFGDM